MIPEEGRGNLQKQNEGIKGSTNCILPHHPSNGRTASLPRSWSFADLNVHDIDYKMGFQPGDECWLCVPLGCTKVWSLRPGFCTLGVALGLVGWEWASGGGSRPEGGNWNLPQVGSGIRSKNSFRQNCDKVSWFSQLLEERWVLGFTAWVSEFFRLQVRQMLHIFPLYLPQL